MSKGFIVLVFMSAITAVLPAQAQEKVKGKQLEPHEICAEEAKKQAEGKVDPDTAYEKYLQSCLKEHGYEIQEQVELRDQ